MPFDKRKTTILLARFALAFFTFGFCLAVVEIGLHLFWRPQLATWQRNITTTLEIDPAIIPGVAGPAHINTNSMGIRGDQWSGARSQEYRILAIGGSTTECLLNDQPNTWPALLQTRLGTMDGRKVWVGNVGHGGFNSRHHVLEMKYMLDQYDPDTVIILTGGNDMGVLLDEGMSYDPNFIYDAEKMRNLALEDFVEKPVSILKPPDTAHLKTVRNLYVALLLRNTLHRYQTPRGLVHDVELYRRLKDLRRHAWLVVHDMPPDLQLGLKGYGNNIREMIRLAKQRHVRLIFMTQPELYQPNMSQQMVDQIWAGWIGDPSLNIYWSPEVLGAVVNAHNKLLLDICSQEGIECIDLAATIPKSLDVFFDHAHFTDYGCGLVADALVNHFHSVTH